MIASDNENTKYKMDIFIISVARKQSHLRGHGEADLTRQTAGLGEHVEVPGQKHWFLYEQLIKIERTENSLKKD